MKIVRTFATSANLGAGFDTLGICLNLYNEYSFSKSNSFLLKGFDERYCNQEDNLIIKSYKKVFKKYNKEILPIKLEELTRNIPTSRGLGSSASCIVAGVMIANEMLDNILTKDEMFQIATDIEVHPDNVAPLIYGGFTSSFYNNDYYHVDLKVNKNLRFYLFIPTFELETKTARSVIKREIMLDKAVSNIANAVASVKAIEDGNIENLILSNQDVLHEPYRLPLIKGSRELKELCKKNNASCYISGAGSTMIAISNQPLDKIKHENFKKIEVKVEEKGAYIYEK